MVVQSSPILTTVFITIWLHFSSSNDSVSFTPGIQLPVIHVEEVGGDCSILESVSVASLTTSLVLQLQATAVSRAGVLPLWCSFQFLSVLNILSHVPVLKALYHTHTCISIHPFLIIQLRVTSATRACSYLMFHFGDLVLYRAYIMEVLWRGRKKPKKGRK